MYSPTRCPGDGEFASPPPFDIRKTKNRTFYVNLPVGAVALFMILISFNCPNVNRKSKSVSLRDSIRLFGPLVRDSDAREPSLYVTIFEQVIFIPGIVSLLLALRWGGSKYSWNSGRIIALIIVFGVLISIFVALQIWKQDQATVPPRIFMQRRYDRCFISICYC